jgi:membrane protease YdiL (CAAX protease family)
VRPVWLFFAATYALSWALWATPAIQGRLDPYQALMVLGVFAASTMGIVFTAISGGRDALRDLWRRTFDRRLLRSRWLVVIFLLVPLTHLLAGWLAPLLGGEALDFPSVPELLAKPSFLLELLLLNFVLSGLAEEFGWRGFAQDRLQRRYGALGAALIVGLFHGFWHTPLFLIPGISQGEMGFFTLDYFLFVAMSLPLSILFAWIYNNTGRSVLSAILTHFWLNTVLNAGIGTYAGFPTRYIMAYLVVTTALCVIIVLVWGSRTLSGRERSAPTEDLEPSRTALEGPNA